MGLAGSRSPQVGGGVRRACPEDQGGIGEMAGGGRRGFQTHPQGPGLWPGVGPSPPPRASAPPVDGQEAGMCYLRALLSLAALNRAHSSPGRILILFHGDSARHLTLVHEDRAWWSGAWAPGPGGLVGIPAPHFPSCVSLSKSPGLSVIRAFLLLWWGDS